MADPGASGTGPSPAAGSRKAGVSGASAPGPPGKLTAPSPYCPSFNSAVFAGSIFQPEPFTVTPRWPYQAHGLATRTNPCPESPNSFWNSVRTSAVMRDGVYHTGDIARREQLGYLTFVGRTVDVFKASDYRISPFELESVLIEHDAIVEAAVGLPPNATSSAPPAHTRRATASTCEPCRAQSASVQSTLPTSMQRGGRHAATGPPMSKSQCAAPSLICPDCARMASGAFD